MSRCIYVASSWRNRLQPLVVAALIEVGLGVYDFRHPEPGNEGFRWSDIDPEWQGWDPQRFRACLEHPIARKGFRLDWGAMLQADIGVLVLPCGRSAHLEAGYFVGAGKPLHILMTEPQEPELMYKMATAVHTSLDELVSALAPKPVVRPKEPSLTDELRLTYLLGPKRKGTAP
jgi:hypothetical protein